MIPASIKTKKKKKRTCNKSRAWAPQLVCNNSHSELAKANKKTKLT